MATEAVARQQDGVVPEDALTARRDARNADLDARDLHQFASTAAPRAARQLANDIGLVESYCEDGLMRGVRIPLTDVVVPLPFGPMQCRSLIASSGRDTLEHGRRLLAEGRTSEQPEVAPLRHMYRQLQDE